MEINKNIIGNSNLKIYPSKTLLKKQSERRKCYKYCYNEESLYSSKTVKKGECILPYMRFLKSVEKDRKRKFLKLPIVEKTNANNTEINIKLCDSLNENHSDSVVDIKQIDENYFESIVNGRSNVLLYKSITPIFCKYIKIRQEIGYKNDCILNIEVNYKRELMEYNKCLEQITEQAKYFETFIAEDYKNTTLFLKNIEVSNKKVNNKMAELQHLATKQLHLTSTIIDLNYKYHLQQRYGRFLYYLSPPSWRMKNRDFALSFEIEAKGFDLGFNDHDLFSSLFENIRSEFNSRIIKPVMYFQTHKDLIDIFSQLERQYSRHFNRIMRIRPYAHNLKLGIEALRTDAAHHGKYDGNTIDSLQNILKINEIKCTELESSFYKLLNGVFYETVGSCEVLKLILNLRYCYEKVYEEPSESLDIVTLAKYLESFYFDYCKRLDNINSKNVRQIMNKIMVADRRAISRAISAAQNLHYYQRLEQKLLRNTLPGKLISSSYKSQKIKSSINTTEKKSKTSISIIKTPLSEDELEYLRLFTHWTENEDPNLYLQRAS